MKCCNTTLSEKKQHTKIIGILQYQLTEISKSTENNKENFLHAYKYEISLSKEKPNQRKGWKLFQISQNKNHKQTKIKKNTH